MQILILFLNPLIFSNAKRALEIAFGCFLMLVSLRFVFSLAGY